PAHREGRVGHLARQHPRARTGELGALERPRPALQPARRRRPTDDGRRAARRRLRRGRGAHHGGRQHAPPRGRRGRRSRRVSAPWDDALLEEIAALGTATMYEAAGATGVVDLDLECVRPGLRIAGPARTVLCGPGDHRAVHEAVASLSGGEIVVITAVQPSTAALIGDLLSTQLQVHGARGVLVDGAVRDTEEIAALGLPVW